MPLQPLPREVESGPDAAAIRRRLSAGRRPLWAGGTAAVPVVRLRAPLAESLAAAWQRGQVVLGLEATTAALAEEALGLAALAARPGHAQGARVSRLLFVSADGAERFYRQVERLLAQHGARLLVVVLDAAAAEIGRAVTGRDAAVKAVLVRHKTAVATALRALAY